MRILYQEAAHHIAFQLDHRKKVPVLKIFFFLSWIFFGRRITHILKRIYRIISLKSSDWDLSPLSPKDIGANRFLYLFRNPLNLMFSFRRSCIESGVSVGLKRLLEHMLICSKKIVNNRETEPHKLRHTLKQSVLPQTTLSEINMKPLRNGR